MKKNLSSYRLSILIASICFGFIPIFGQALTNLGIPSFKQTFFMETFAFLIITPFFLWKLKTTVPKKKDYLFFFLFGICLFFVNFLPLTAISLGLPVALVTLLVYMHPGFTLFISRLWFKEKITIKKLIYVFIALIGVIFLLKSGQFDGVLTLPGLIVGILSGLALSLWGCFGKESGARGYTPFDTFYWSEVSAVLVLLLAAFLIPFLPTFSPVGTLDFTFTPTSFGLLVLMSFVTTVVGHTLFFRGIDKLTMVEGSVLALFEPITVIILGYLVFSQSIGFEMLFGGFLILLTSVLMGLEK